SQVEEFWVSDKSGHCCQIPQHMSRDCFLCEEFDGCKNRRERLRSFGFPLKVGVGNDAPTFNTPDLAGPVFLLRNGIGDQAAVRTGVGRALRERRWGLSWSFDVHDAAL